MLHIAFSLLGGWILSLFGFNTVLIAGMLQFFGLAINMYGYYFFFAMLGVARNIASILSIRNRNGEKPTVDLSKTWDWNSKKK